MSKNSDAARLRQILEYISDIEKIIIRHKTIEIALDDLEGHHAVLMCLGQIGEKMNKLESSEFRAVLPVRYA